MNKTALLNIIQQGENERVEFKSSFNRAVIETIVAFANTRGGTVILGCNDDKKIVGVSVTEQSVQNWINEVKQNTEPQVIPNVWTEKVSGKDVVVFEVIEYPVKPVSYKNKYYKRVLNSNHLMNIDEISNEYLKTINSSWDFYPDPHHTLEHISEKKIEKFIRRIENRTGTEITLSPGDFLSKLEIIRDKQLTFGGYLLFVEDYCLISDVQVGRFKSDTKIIDSISFETDLFTEVDEIIAFIKKHLMVEYIITGEPQRQERYDYPLDAIREIVINMVVHRDYRDSSGSVIKIYDNRIEFFNPGKLYGDITVDDLLSGYYTSRARNKLIAKAFKEVGLIEQFGSGIRRILNICKGYGIVSPKFEEIFNGFMVTLFKEKGTNSDIVTNAVTNDVTNDRLSVIMQTIIKNPKISTQKLADFCKVSKRTILRDIEKLKEKRQLKRIGKVKNGFWKVIL